MELKSKCENIYEAHHKVLNMPRRQTCAIFERKQDKDKQRMFIQKIEGITDALI